MPKKGKKPKDIDWADDAHFDENRAMVYVEHTEECPIFRIKAIELASYFQSQFPNKMIQLVRNKNGKQVPRPGSFEVSFSHHARTSVYDLWSGIDKGPPRREKIPKDFELLLPEVTRILKKIYVVPVARVEENVTEDKDMDD